MKRFFLLISVLVLLSGSLLAQNSACGKLTEWAGRDKTQRWSELADKLPELAKIEQEANQSIEEARIKACSMKNAHQATMFYMDAQGEATRLKLHKGWKYVFELNDKLLESCRASHDFTQCQYIRLY